MNRYDWLNFQIRHWESYLKLHTKIYSKKQMGFAWFGRMVRISKNIDKMKKERDNYATN